METQKTPNSQNNLEKEKRNFDITGKSMNVTKLIKTKMTP